MLEVPALLPSTGDLPMRLSRNFTLQELVKSRKAEELGVDNTPGQNEIENLKRVAEHILQPIRDHYKISFSPTSGYRCRALNRALGSRNNSQHIKGQAVDLKILGVPNYELAKWIKCNLVFDQLILENHVMGDPSSGWVHCSYVPDSPRRQVLTIAGRTLRTGLVV
jgi:hypothetical protein